METSLNDLRASRQELANLSKSKKKAWEKCCSTPRKGKEAIAANTAHHQAMSEYLDEFWNYKEIRQNTLGF